MPTRRVRTGAGYVTDPGGGPDQWQVTYEEQEYAGSYVADPGGGPDQWQYAQASSLDATKVALLGDSLIMLAYQNIAPDGGIAEAAGTFTITDSGLTPHGLLEGGRVFGFSLTEPTATATRTMSSWVDASNGSGSTTSTAGGVAFHNLQRFQDWGSWAPMWNALEGWPVDFVPAGMAGALAADLDDWIATHVTPTDVGAVFLSAGRNDCSGSDSAATIFGYINSAVTTLRGQGRKVVVCTIPPNDAAGAVRTKIEAVNALIRAMSFNANLILLDVYAELDDGAGDWGANMAMADLIHPSPLGCYTVALAAQTALAGLFDDRDILPTTSTADQTQKVTNPLLTGTAGSRSGAGIAAGDVADNWTVAGSAAAVLGTPSKEARGDGYGDNQVVGSITSTAAGQVLTIRSASAHGNFTAGDRIYAVAEMTVADMTAIRRLQLLLSATDEDSTLAQAASWGFAAEAHAAALQSQANKTVIAKTGEITLTNALTNLQVLAQVLFAGASSGGTFKVGRVGIYKVVT